jgi:hypothetical protein
MPNWLKPMIKHAQEDKFKTGLYAGQGLPFNKAILLKLLNNSPTQQPTQKLWPLPKPATTLPTYRV